MTNLRTGAKMIAAGIKTAFGYHAVLDKNRRTAPKSITKSEDDHLDKTNRKKLVATARDNRRNQALLAWMIRKHIDYVASFRFQSSSGDRAFDRDLEQLVEWFSRADNFDVAGRHGLHEFLRIAEGHRVVDGDIGILFARNGKLQGIEGDRIAKPTKGMIPKLNGELITDDDLTHGVITNQFGGARYYCVCDRDGESLVFNRYIPGRDIALIGYFDRFDQVRGISPLASAINTLTDLYETFDAALVKQKMSSMFGVAIKSERVEESDPWASIDSDTGAAPTSTTSKYDFDLRPGLKLELDAGDDIKVIESDNPSTDFRAYNEFLIQVSMLALDIPVTFFDSRKSSYSAQRQDLLAYYESVQRKRIQLADFLNRMTIWKLSRWTNEGTISLPRGTDLRNLKWKWLPPAFPWIDPLKEVEGYGRAINLGLSSRQRVCSLMGTDFWDTLDQLGEEEQAIVDKGVTVQVAQPGAIITRDEEADNPAEQQGV